MSQLNLTIYPNPNNGILQISFNLQKNEDVTVSISNINGKLIEKVVVKNTKIGKNTYTNKIESLAKGSIYLVTVQTSTEKITHRLIVKSSRH